MIREGRVKVEADHKEKVNQLQLDLNIARSKAVNSARILKMKEREVQLRAMRDEMLEDLKELRSKQRDKYMKTLSNLVLQSMIRMLEPEIYIMCREEDKDDVEAMVSDLQSQYSTFMNEKTGRDYETKINVIDDRFLTDDKDLGCGGVIVYNSDKTIMCPNMICSRLNQAFEECLPSIRSKLFPTV